MMDERDWIEIGKRASWSVSTAKPGNGVELMRDDETTTYWQSDGQQPHLIDIKFDRKMHILELQLFFDFRMDESYTPCRMCIRGGSSYCDLKEIYMKEFHEPRGWQKISLQALGSIEIGDPPSVFRVKLLQLAILSNHQNGRDSHIRQIKIYGPKREAIEPMIQWQPPIPHSQSPSVLGEDSPTDSSRVARDS